MTAPAPLDREWLGRWMDPRHVAGDAVARRRASFDAHPARLVVLPAFLRNDVADRLAAFLERDAEYAPLHGLYSREPHDVPREEWLAAPEADRFWRFSVLAGASRPSQLTPGLIAYLRLRRAWSDSRTVAFFEQLCGVRLTTLTSFHVHAMSGGDYLRPHRDAVGRRRLAFVLFLTRRWERTNGGRLMVSMPDEGGAVEIAPEFNTLIVFDVRAATEHWVTPVAAGAPPRITAGGWIDE